LDARPGGTAAPELVIGLVNNMPDAALQATEAQFRGLLEAAAGTRRVALQLIALPQVPRGAVGRRLLEQRYRGPELLGEMAFDGLIVTGTEPRCARLQDEPYWDEFTALVSWAQARHCPTIWSCLAAHAAVLHLDGIERRRLPDKLFGLFECPAQGAHPLAAGLSARRRVPQSRYNDLPEDALRRAGYVTLARSDAVGADFFVRDAGAEFVFLQGHPEYDRPALLREYRRDVGRYLAGEREALPALPVGYFDAAVRARLEAFAVDAPERREPQQLAGLPLQETDAPDAALWRTDAERLYANWFERVAQLSAARRELAA
jgi:homoserine O-succinyltransferase